MKFKITKDGLSYLGLSIILLLLIPTRFIVRILEFTYRDLSYGQLIPTYENAYSGIYLIIVYSIVLTLFVKYKKIKIFKPKEERTLLPVSKILILTAMTTIPILIISGILGWEIKVVADLGDRYTLREFREYMASYVYIIPMVIAVVISMVSFQHFFDLSVEMDNKKIQQYLPIGGVFILLTFGIVQLVLNTHGTFSILYFLFCIYFCFIYFLTERSLPKTILLVLLIYIF